MDRDWKSNLIQAGVLAIMLSATVVGGVHYIDTQFAAAAETVDKRLNEQNALIVILQAQQQMTQKQIDRTEAFQASVTSKLDIMSVQIGSIATDLALFRKEARH